MRSRTVLRVFPCVLEKERMVVHRGTGVMFVCVRFVSSAKHTYFVAFNMFV